MFGSLRRDYLEIRLWKKGRVSPPISGRRIGQTAENALQQNYKLYLDKYWRPMQLDMVNHIDEKRTILVYESYKFRLGLTERDFDKNALKRAR